MNRRYWPVIVLLVVLVAFVAAGGHRYLSCDALAQHRGVLVDWVTAHQVLSVVVFFVIYTAAVAFSLPGALVLSIAGGFLFGAILGSIMIVLAATLGATILFLIAKSAFGDVLRARAGPWLKRMEEGFRENALSYLLVLRLIPLFPFFIVNLVPAVLGVSVGVFVIGTFFGIIPGTVVFVTVGAGLGRVFDEGQTCTTSGILTPEIIIGLVGLAILALLPVLYKKYKANRS